ncbi:GL18770 [Drosophila persimilis]|uniref:GL18770 n=1 Tax=Drosophila persimilis TaxID=7234 RepID=B4G8T6_DROPE|nr:GL18770 [Drosophila persimilis]
MTEVRRRGSAPPPGHYLCGLANWHPAWLQKYATTKMFMGVYGLLGTIQAMSYMYFIVTLTTLEKRFKIPSQTTGIILSGNEISQIMLSLILSYIGGQRNRPRWIAWGIVFCGLSCYILVLPHFIYGAGQDVLQFTKEYQDSLINSTSDSGIPLPNVTSTQSEQLCGVGKKEEGCDDLFTYVPLVLIFLSQFVLGVGNTLYYSLGQTYLDDNTKKTNTPLMLAVAMSLRMIGPVVGFFFGYISLNTFIDPTKTPLIDSKDPRWLGAWWLGWVILGTLMCLFSGLIGLFPKQLPKVNDPIKHNSHLPLAMRHEELKREENLSLSSRFSSNAALDNIGAGAGANADLPKLKDFPRALMRLLRNKLLIFNITSAVFYILGASGFMTFLTKYMEVQFHKNSQSATIVVGPVSILGMVVGLIGSGLVLSKKKPAVSKVLMWNVIVGCVYIMGQISYAFLYCPDTFSMTHVGGLNLTSACNSNCSCSGISYTPVCHEPTDTTYFSACHAGCQGYNAESKLYENCSCLAEAGVVQPNAAQRLLKLLEPTTQPPQLDETTDFTLSGSGVPLLNDENDFEDQLLSRVRRSSPEEVIRPGICMQGCNWSFWVFSITSMIVNWFGSSGRVGNVLGQLPGGGVWGQVLCPGIGTDDDQYVCLDSGSDYIRAPHRFHVSGVDEDLQRQWQLPAVRSDAVPVLHQLFILLEQLCGVGKKEEGCDDLFTYVPLVLIFLSQFVLGVGNTLYYSLGQTYLDDNTKKTNTPLMLAVAMSLRMIGPVVGFFFGYISLNTFIDPTKTPLIDSKDPRWLGAWWLGWVILGTLMCLFSGLIGLFPKQLPKVNDPIKHNSHLPLAMRHEELKREENLSLSSRFSSNAALDNIGAGAGANADLPKLKDFPRALMRLLRNKLLIFNITSAVFYILGASGFMTFLTKYMEVQFHKNSQSATIVVGPVSILGMVVGLIGSGLVLSKKKPAVSKVLMWNVIVGCVYIMGQISYAFLYCPDTFSMTHVGGAGCQGYNAESKLYENCSCLAEAGVVQPNAAQRLLKLPLNLHNWTKPRTSRSVAVVIRPGICMQGCNWSFWVFSITSMIVNWFGSSGRVGNVLVNYRAVESGDKSFAQGLALMMISMFALIPGPIIFGRLIDSTCLVWTKTCNGNGNCQLYDQTRFRYSINFLSCLLTFIGMLFDYLVWYYGRDLDIYGDKEAKQVERANRKDQPITPLLAKKSERIQEEY